jgi:hypothetical protein
MSIAPAGGAAKGDFPRMVNGGGSGNRPPFGGTRCAQVRASPLLGARVCARAGGALAAPAPQALLSRFLEREEGVQGSPLAWVGRREVATLKSHR